MQLNVYVININNILTMASKVGHYFARNGLISKEQF